jgi:CRP/FNR family transcriptional regulator, dissimilatory nitrate respiration regulator
MYKALSQSPVFRGVSPSELETLLNRVHYRVKNYSKGQTIAFRGDTCAELLVLTAGQIRGEMLDFSGKTVEVETVSAPKPIAAAFIFGKKNRFPVDAVANENVQLLSIPRDSLVRMMQLNPIVLTNYLNLISDKTHFLTERLWFMSFKTIKEKLAHYILSLASDEKTQVILPKSQQQLSEFFGVSRPALARVIGQMEKEGLIQCRRRNITICDRKKLETLLSQ